jgi:hypothetical protein
MFDLKNNEKVFDGNPHVGHMERLQRTGSGKRLSHGERSR